MCNNENNQKSIKAELTKRLPVVYIPGVMFGGYLIFLICSFLFGSVFSAWNKILFDIGIYFTGCFLYLIIPFFLPKETSDRISKEPVIAGLILYTVIVTHHLLSGHIPQYELTSFIL